MFRILLFLFLLLQLAHPLLFQLFSAVSIISFHAAIGFFYFSRYYLSVCFVLNSVVASVLDRKSRSVEEVQIPASEKVWFGISALPNSAVMNTLTVNRVGRLYGEGHPKSPALICRG